jgi:hypothetical protein
MAMGSQYLKEQIPSLLIGLPLKESNKTERPLIKQDPIDSQSDNAPQSVVRIQPLQQMQVDLIKLAEEGRMGGQESVYERACVEQLGGSPQDRDWSEIQLEQAGSPGDGGQRPAAESLAQHLQLVAVPPSLESRLPQRGIVLKHLKGEPGQPLLAAGQPVHALQGAGVIGIAQQAVLALLGQAICSEKLLCEGH